MSWIFVNRCHSFDTEFRIQFPRKCDLIMLLQFSPECYDTLMKNCTPKYASHHFTYSHMWIVREKTPEKVSRKVVAVEKENSYYLIARPPANNFSHISVTPNMHIKKQSNCFMKNTCSTPFQPMSCEQTRFIIHFAKFPSYLVRAFVARKFNKSNITTSRYAKLLKN